MASAWAEVKQYVPAIQNYVQNGGKFIGICMGAFLAAGNPAATDDSVGFGLMAPDFADTYTGPTMF